MSVLHTMETHAHVRAGADAYVYLGTGGATASLTWAQLWQWSDGLAYYIRDTFSQRTPVVVYGHKHPLMVVSFLACAKAGRAYCPVDTSMPAPRATSIVEVIEPQLILAMEDPPFATPPGCLVLHLKQIQHIFEQRATYDLHDSWLGPDDVHYLIFTSGSTGRPKGVQIPSGCLDNFVRWGTTLCGNARDVGYVFLNQAPYSFDLSVMDLYLSLCLGGTEVAIDANLAADYQALFAALGKSDATVWVSTPSFAELCLADRSFAHDLLPRLRTFLFCGETLANRMARRLLDAFPQAEVYNTYGPTESTVAVTGVRVTRELLAAHAPLPVGTPKPGTWIRIEDERGNAVPDGERGEIVIVGDTVGAGYLNDAQRTDAVFVTREIEGQPWRAYRTGDEGYLQDDLLFYCGRLDFQVKLHGYRIELEDVEANIASLPGVRRAVVLPILARDGTVRSLTAYVVLDHTPIGRGLVQQDLRRSLGEVLPHYMVPSRINVVDSLPLTANGKMDRKALDRAALGR